MAGRLVGWDVEAGLRVGAAEVGLRAAAAAAEGVAGFCSVGVLVLEEAHRQEESCIGRWEDHCTCDARAGVRWRCRRDWRLLRRMMAGLLVREVVMFILRWRCLEDGNFRSRLPGR